MKNIFNMPPGPPLIGENRFAVLADRSPQSKRKKRNRNESAIDFPSLPKQKPSNPKYVVVSASDEKKPLAKYSCFAVYRSLHLISKEIISITQLRDGNLLLLVKDYTTGKKFVDTKNLFGICEITCKFHEHLNFTKGTIYAPFLSDVPDAEIEDELKSQGVVGVYKYEKTIEGVKSPSGVILLTFDLYNPPQSLEISWYKVKVREYFPNPMRCKNCQLLGHTKKRCKGSPSCVNCNLPPHAETECTRTYCANCAEEHPASSNQCTKFIQQKEVLKIKTKRKCSMREALTIYNEQTKNITPSSTSYSTIASTNQIINSNSTKANQKNNSNNTTTNPKTTPETITTNTNILKTTQLKDKLSSIISEHIKNGTSDLSKLSKRESKEEFGNNLSSNSQTLAKSKIENYNKRKQQPINANLPSCSGSQSANNISSISPVVLSELSSDCESTIREIEFMSTGDEVSD